VTHSEQINEIATALAKAQSQISPAVKSAANPYFKSKYADLASVWDACRAALTANGIAVVQSPSSTDDGRVSVTTMLVHGSGQWLAETLTVKPKDDGPQALGSVITYLRRYALAAFAGVAPEDDDAQAAEGQKTGAKAVSKPVAVKPAGFEDWLTDMELVAEQGTAALQSAWKSSKPDYRNALDPSIWESIKSRAAKVPQQVA